MGSYCMYSVRYIVYLIDYSYTNCKETIQQFTLEVVHKLIFLSYFMNYSLVIITSSEVAFQRLKIILKSSCRVMHIT